MRLSSEGGLFRRRLLSSSPWPAPIAMGAAGRRPLPQTGDTPPRPAFSLSSAQKDGKSKGRDERCGGSALAFPALSCLSVVSSPPFASGRPVRRSRAPDRTRGYKVSQKGGERRRCPPSPSPRPLTGEALGQVCSRSPRGVSGGRQWRPLQKASSPPEEKGFFVAAAAATRGFPNSALCCKASRGSMRGEHVL